MKIKMNLEDVVISVAQKQGWAVTIERKAETDTIFDFEKFTPKGQDFNFSVCTSNNSLGLLIDNILDYYQNYDPDYEAYLWIGPDGHGKNGAPYHIADIVEDMEAAAEMVYQLYDALRNVYDA